MITKLIKGLLFFTIALFFIGQIFSTINTSNIPVYEFKASSMLSKELLNSNIIDSIQIIDSTTANIFIKNEKINEALYITPNDSIFSFYINDIQSFLYEINDSHYNSNIKFYNRKFIEYESGFLKIWGIILILFIISIFWSLIDILKGSFTKGIDKLIWLILVILLPIIGMYLYIYIGIKQKET